MRRPALLATAALVLSTAALGLVAFEAGATHLGTGNPDCRNTVSAASSGSYDVGRVRFSGYASGAVGGVDLKLVDEVSPPPAPDVFDPDPDGGPQHFQVAGGLVSLSAPGLQNTFLNGGPPVTEVKEDAYPLDTTVDTHSGAQTLSMIFNGEATIYPPESFTCESVHSNLIWTFTIQKVELDGWATAITSADDGNQEQWGLGAGIQVSPGDTSDA